MSDGTQGEVTLVGRVSGEAQLIGATLRAGDKHYARDRGDGFTLVLDNGDHVTVEARATSIITQPRTRECKRWHELAATPLGALFDDVAPGDHVEVELAGSIIRAGDRVAIRGGVGDVELVGGGPREMAEARPQRVVARTIAIVDGDEADARAALDREDARVQASEARAARAQQIKPAKAKQPRRPRPWRITAPVFQVIGASGVVLALGLWSRPVAPLAFALGALFATLGLTMTLSLPPFDAVASPTRARFKPAWKIGGWCAWALVVHLVVSAAAASYVAAGAHGAASVPLVLGALCGLGLLALVGRRHRVALRLARLLLRAPAQPVPLVDGTWGRFAGTVATSGVGLARVVSYQHCVTYKRPGQPEDIWKLEAVPDEQQRVKTVDVRAGDQLVTVSGELYWGAPLEYQPVDKLVVYSTRSALEHESSVVVLSRLRRDGDVLVARGTGPESVILFAASRNDALGTLRSLTMTWLGRAALVAILIVAQLSLALWITS